MKINTFVASEKQSQMLELLKYGTVMAFVDSRHTGVVVPDYLKGDYQLRLNFDYAFEIDDFRVLPDRLEASLSFNRKNFFCVVPFDAIYLLLNHGIKQGSLFVDSVPVEMLELFSTVDKVEPKAKSKPNALKAVPKANASEPQPENPIATAISDATVPETKPADEKKAEPSEDKGKKRSSHLRLVK